VGWNELDRNYTASQIIGQIIGHISFDIFDLSFLPEVEARSTLSDFSRNENEK
jgi:hypothetical protein